MPQGDKSKPRRRSWPASPPSSAGLVWPWFRITILRRSSIYMDRCRKRISAVFHGRSIGR